MLAIEVDAATELPEPRHRRRLTVWPFWVVLVAIVIGAVSPALRYVTN